MLRLKINGNKLLECNCYRMAGGFVPDDIAIVPDRIEEIADRAFSYCSCRRIELPNGLKKIGDYIFQDGGVPTECIEYENGSYIGSKENPYMILASISSSSDGRLNIHPDTRFIDSKAYNSLSDVAAREIVFGDKLEFIGWHAFVYGHFTDVEIPDSVTRIREGAFADCRELTRIKLPNGLAEIEEMMFFDCEKLKEVILPEKLVSIGISAFRGCSALTEITIGGQVEHISRDAFVDCTALKKVVIGNNVKTIGSGAFERCSALEYVTLPEGLTEISSELFRGCKNLKSVKIPDSVTKIGSNAFYQCSALEEITISANVTEIMKCPFNECTSLKRIIVDPQNKNYCIQGNKLIEISTSRPIWSLDENSEVFVAGEGKTKIGLGEHRDNRYIKNLRIDSNVENIDNFAFFGCKALENIEFNDKLKMIGYRAFQKCSALMSITLPKSFTECGWDIFQYCTSLKTVVFKGALPQANAGMFDGCTSLEKIVIPSAKELGTCFLSECTSLAEITLPADLEKIGDKAFYHCRGLKRIDIPESVVFIGNNAFNGCTSLEEVNILGDNVKIMTQAFYNCSALKRINIGRGTTLNDSDFVGCDNLKKITLAPDHPLYYEADDCILKRADDMLVFVPYGKTDLPDCIKRIGAGIFCGESRMKKYVVPNGVEEIVDEAFASTDLEEITLPASLKFISLDAFAYCNNLRKIYFKGTRAEWHAVDIDQDSYDCEGDENYFNLVNSTVYSSVTEVICSDGTAD